MRSLENFVQTSFLMTESIETLLFHNQETRVRSMREYILDPESESRFLPLSVMQWAYWVQRN